MAEPGPLSGLPGVQIPLLSIPQSHSCSLWQQRGVGVERPSGGRGGILGLGPPPEALTVKELEHKESCPTGFFCLFGWLHCAVGGVLVPQPRMEPSPGNGNTESLPLDRQVIPCPTAVHYK